MSESLPDNIAVPDYASLLRLDGRGFVVLGAGQGIGRQAAHALAQMGAGVVTVDREADLATAVADELGANGTPWVGDITQRAEVERLVDEASATRSAGASTAPSTSSAWRSTRPCSTPRDELWEWEHDIVLRHAWLTMQRFGRVMARRRRRVARLRRIGIRYRRCAAALVVRCVQGGADGARSLGSGRARTARHPRQRRRTRCRVDAACLRLPR